MQDLKVLSLSDDRYAYLLLIPVNSAVVLYLERQRIFSGIRSARPPRTAALWAGALAVFSLLGGLLAWNLIPLPAEIQLSIKVLFMLLVWAAAFALCFGPPALKAAKFPFLLLLLMAPIPSSVMDKIVTGLQTGSADATYALFRLAGVPVFRIGVNFELPIIGIEVAKECSSIHSGSALFIVSLLVGHLLLRSLPAKVCLTLLSIPIAMLSNAVRITTLWFLATKVDVGFLYGNPHHNGGILFALLALCILMSCLYLLRKLEDRQAVR
ncbi:MAG: exosortase/archaeosortase family protein, partial [Terriglobales bacterium]